MSGSRVLRTMSCQRATRHIHPCATACQSANSTGPASSGRSRAHRCRPGHRTRFSNRVECQVWINFVTGSLCHDTWSRRRMGLPMVRCLCTAHGCRSSRLPFGPRTAVTACTSRYSAAAPTPQSGRARIRARSRKLTLCTYRAAIRFRKDCGCWREVTPSGRGEAPPRQVLHCQRWMHSRPRLAKWWPWMPLRHQAQAPQWGQGLG